MAGQDQAYHDPAGGDQLEIIGPDGQIRFYELDADKGITNIGRDPNNDVVVDSPGVGAFHAVLDHRQRPYQIMLLTTQGDTRLRGRPLEANAFQELHDWDTLEVDGHSIILMQAAAPSVALPVMRPPVVRPPVVPPAPRAAPEPAGPPTTAPSALLPRDQTDELIVTEISGREWTIDVEQTAMCQLTIVNGGNIVAGFAVAVEGVPEGWVIISPPRVNLNEGARAIVSITITPPRLPASRAGAHPLVFVVTSPNYAEHMSRISATLFINPYHAFTVGEMSPKQQTVSWRKPTGQVTMPITNEGNSETPFRVDGDDEERACRFEFQVPGDTVSLVRQAEVRLKPEQTLTLPIDITPTRRRLIGLRKRNYSFTVTTTMLEGAMGGVMPRSIMGRLSAKPLIGPLTLLLILASLAALVIILGRPVGQPDLAGDRAELSHGEELTLTYDASRFAGLDSMHLLNRLNALFLRLTLEFRPLDGAWTPLKTGSELHAPDGSVVDVPLQDGHYRLRAENWISALVPRLGGESRYVAINVDPVNARIVRFRVDRDSVYVGEEVQLVWAVARADSLTFTYDEDGTPIPEELVGADLESGRRQFVITNDTTFTLVAANSSGSQPDTRTLRVRAIQPPVPTPMIVRFDVAPLEITLGEAVQIVWEVTGADTVKIDPLGEVPPEGERGDEPPGRTTYQLVASKTGPDGATEENIQSREVIVNTPPPPTPEPRAPVIDLFEAIPKEVVAGEAEEVELTWSVLGETTAIEITTSELSITGLAAQDVVTVTVNETTLFVLTAANGDLKTSKAIEIKALEPTPTPEPTATPVPPPTPEPTPTPVPPPIISYLTAEGVDPNTDRVTFTGVITGPKYVYEVQSGSNVRIRWGVKNADVVLVGEFGPQPPEGEMELPTALQKSGEILLTAQNNEGKNEVKAWLKFDITSPPAPPPPYYVTGIEDAPGGKNTIIWSYVQADRDRIEGFRVYRAPVPGANFVMIAFVEDRDATEWADYITPTCGLGYYVVAVYVEAETGALLETAASLTSWYSRSCP